MCHWKRAAVLSCKEKQHKGGVFLFWGLFFDWFGFGVGFFLVGLGGFFSFSRFVFENARGKELHVIKTSTVMYWKL